GRCSPPRRWTKLSKSGPHPHSARTIDPRRRLAIRALPDLCLGIVTERLEAQPLWSFFILAYLESPSTPGAFLSFCRCSGPPVPPNRPPLPLLMSLPATCSSMQAIDKSHQGHRRTRLGDIVSTAEPLNARIASNRGGRRHFPAWRARAQDFIGSRGWACRSWQARAWPPPPARQPARSPDIYPSPLRR